MSDTQVRRAGDEPPAATTTGDTSVRQRLLLAVRVLLAAALVVTGTAQLVSYTTTTYDALGDDLAEGRVSWMGFGYLAEDDAAPMGTSFELTRPELATAVVWRTGPVGLRAVRFDGLGPVEGIDTSQWYDADGDRRPGYDAAFAAALAEKARQGGADVSVSGDEPVLWRLARWSWYVLLAMAISMALGPQPRRATRWAWLWRLWLPFGVGGLWLLAREAPWSRAASALPAPLPAYLQRRQPEGDRRFTGGLALVALIGAWFIADVVMRRLT